MIEEINMIIRVNSLNVVFGKLENVNVWKHKEYDREKTLNYFERMAEVIRKD